MHSNSYISYENTPNNSVELSPTQYAYIDAKRNGRAMRRAGAVERLQRYITISTTASGSVHQEHSESFGYTVATKGDRYS